MVYKKYIKRGGKTYGPYSYKSRKENGKVITEYLGKDDDKTEHHSVPPKLRNVGGKNSWKKKFLGAFFIFGLVAIFLLLVFMNLGFTGRVALQVKNSYFPGEQIQGNLELSLKEGELIPTSTKIIIDNSGEVSEFLLSDLISEQILDGEFYAEGTSVSGGGQGYGIIGEKKIYPTIYFELGIIEKSSEISGGETESTQIVEEENVTETPAEKISEQPAEEIPTEQSTENIPVEQTPEIPAEESQQQPETTESIETPTEEISETETSAPITGETIGENKIKGEVSFNNLFTYDLPEGETAEIKLNSVRTDSTTLSENDVDLKIESGQVIVTTDYYEVEGGFGEDYLTDDIIKFNIDLSQFGLTAKEGLLIIKLIYNEQEISILSKSISVETEEPVNETEILIENVTEIPVENMTEIPENVTEIPENITVEQNVTEQIPVENISLLQYKAIIGKPVKWIKVIKTTNETDLIEIPKTASNISVRTGDEVQQALDELNEYENVVDEADRQKLADGTITGMVSMDIKENMGILSRLWNWILGIGITGNVIQESEIENSITETTDKKIVDVDKIVAEEGVDVAVEYYTEASSVVEENLTNGKRITISAADELGYTDILAYSLIDRNISMEDVNKIRLYWYEEVENVVGESEEEVVEESKEIINETVEEEIVTEENQTIQEEVVNESIEQINETQEQNSSLITGQIISEENNLLVESNQSSEPASEQSLQEKVKKIINFTAYDLDGDGYVDYIEWNVPHLSEQVYDLIYIVKAEHLDANRSFISDIYDETKTLDGVWSEVINDSEYVRVTFEQMLDNTKDITIYARSPRDDSGEPSSTESSSIEVYTEDSDELVTSFESITNESYYKVNLTNLNGSYDVFDLKVSGNAEFDYIVDPSVTYTSTASWNGTFYNTTVVNGGANVTIPKEMSDNQYDEKLLSSAGANMTGNVLLMHLNEVSGNALDSSGLGNNGVVTGATQNVAGKLNTAYSFDGNDRVNTTSAPNISIPFFIQAGKINAGGVGIVGATTLSSNTWYHGVISGDGTTAYIYLNGNLDGSGACAAWMPNPFSVSVWFKITGSLGAYAAVVDLWGGDSKIKIGGPNNPANSYFIGTIDEVAIWNRSLSATEIMEIYQRGSVTHGSYLSEIINAGADSVWNNISWNWVNSEWTTDVCNGGTASADSTYTTYYPSQAFDNNVATWWNSASPTSPPWWLTYDFGAGVTRRIEKIAFDAYTTNTNSTLRGSNDNSTWTTITTINYTLAGGVWQNFTFNNPNSYRYYTFNISSSGGSDMAIREIEMFERTGLNLQVRSCNDALCNGETFVGNANTSASNFTSSPVILNTTITPNNQWFQFNVSFVTSDTTKTPVLEDVTVGWSGANSAPSVPTNLQPANNTILSDTTPLLNWTNSTDIDGNALTYNLDVATSLNFYSLGENLTDGFSITSSGAGNAFGITTNGSDFWVTDTTDFFVYHFNSAGVNQTDGFSTTSFGSSNPRGITTNGTDLWMVDGSSDYVYHLDLVGNSLSGGFSTHNTGSYNAFYGITTNGSDFWITSIIEDTVYHLSNNGTLIDSFNTIDIAYYDITTNGSDFWILDTNPDFVYHFNSSGDNQSDGFDITDAGAANPVGITSNCVFPRDLGICDITDFWITDLLDDFVYHFSGRGLSYSALGITETATPTSHTVASALSDGNYWWRVRADDGTVNGTYAYGNFTILSNTAPSVPELNAPLNATNWSSIPFLNWSNSTDSDGNPINYSLEVDDDYAFSSINYQNHTIAETTNTTGDTPTGLTLNTKYFWRVLAMDGTINSSWSEVWDFNYDAINPSITFIYPTNASNFSTADVDVNFTIIDTNLNSCWYSNDSGITNHSITCGQNITNITNWDEGLNTIWVYADDIVGNLNNTESISFTVDTINPNINFTSPTPDNATNQNVNSIYVNYSVNDTNPMYSFINFDRSLAGWWRFEGNASDESGYGNNGTCSGTSCPSNVSGKFGGAYDFDGNDYVNIDSAVNDLSSTTTGTWSAWVKPTDATPSNYPQIIAFGYTNTNEVIRIYSTTTGTIVGQGRTGASSKWVLQTTNPVLSDNTWTHISIVQNGIEPVLYINGIAVLQTFSTSVDKTIWFSGTAVNNGRIGSVNAGSEDNFFNGTIDDVAIWNRSLSAEEITALYNATSTYHNFTSQSEGTHTFTGYAVDFVGNKNQTEQRSVAVDTIYPQVNITYPTNASNFSTSDVDVNFTISDINLQACWWSNTTGLVNHSITCGQNITNITNWDEGLNTIWVYADDTLGNLNNTESISFTVDTAYPIFSNYGVNITNGTEYSFGNCYDFNVTVTNTNGSVICNFNTTDYIASNVSDLFNITICDLSAGLIPYNWTAYGNGTVHNRNNSATYYYTIERFTQTFTPLLNGAFANLSATYPQEFNASFSGTNYTYLNISIEGTFTNQTLIAGSIYYYPAGNYTLNYSLEENTNYTNLEYTLNLTIGIAIGNGSLYLNNATSNLTIINGTTVQINASLDTGSGYIQLWNNGTMINNGTSPIYNLSTFDNVGNITVNLTYLGNINYTAFEKQMSISIKTDNEPPLVTINSPLTTTTTPGSINFSVTLNEIGNCSYSIDSGVTNVTMNTSDFLNYYNLQTLTAASYTANFYCNDSLGNDNLTESRSFTLAEATAGTAGTTTPSGGGGGGGVPPQFNLGVASYETTLSVGMTEDASIQLVNTENSEMTFYITTNLENIILLEESVIKLKPKESTNIRFNIIAPSEPGLYPGIIFVKIGSVTKQILISINVNTEKSLYDLIMTIPKTLKTIKPGENLEAQIYMLQAGLKESMDVTLNYVIKDFNGEVYFGESETVQVYDQKTYNREFHTAELSEGDYILGVELIYPDGVAVASSQFKIQSPIRATKQQIILTSLIIGILIVFIAIWFSIKKYKHRTHK